MGECVSTTSVTLNEFAEAFTVPGMSGVEVSLDDVAPHDPNTVCEPSPTDFLLSINDGGDQHSSDSEE